MKTLYTKASRFLFVFGAIVSGFLIPWSEDIVRVLLGPSYTAGAPALAIMLVSSIYMAAGQLNGVLLYAASRTKEQLFFGSILMAFSLPISYFMQAPPEAMIPGLELGAFGMALKRTLFMALQLNIMVWWIRRSYGWKFDWAYQVVGLVGSLFLGWAVHKAAVVLIAPVSSGLFFTAGIAFVLYVVMIGVMIWVFPWVAGLQRDEFLRYLKNPFKIS
jgi:O-antigen/teichoic acid export membrane protein